MVTIESKDLRRLEDIKAQPGKELGLASKQAKLIKDPAKATRRWLASVSIFGSDHPVTQIFNSRKWELNGADVAISGNVTVRVEAKVKPQPEPVATVEEAKIKRSQGDFPIGCGVKSGDKKGTVIQHDILDNEKLLVDFEGTEETVSIYQLKRC